MSQAKIALINEATCIGCTKCLQSCPVDAIIGAAKQMHSILTEHCIGCGWCLPPCPVSCIEMIASEPLPATARFQQAQVIKQRVKRRKERLALQAEQKALADKQVTAGNMKDIITAAIARKTRPGHSQQGLFPLSEEYLDNQGGAKTPDADQSSMLITPIPAAKDENTTDFDQ